MGAIGHRQADDLNDRRQTANSAGLNQGATFNLRLPEGCHRFPDQVNLAVVTVFHVHLMP